MNLALTNKGTDAAAAQTVKHQVLGHRKTRHPQLVRRLMHDDDAGLTRSPWRSEPHLAASDKDAPLVGLHHAGRDLGQR